MATGQTSGISCLFTRTVPAGFFVFVPDSVKELFQVQPYNLCDPLICPPAAGRSIPWEGEPGGRFLKPGFLFLVNLDGALMGAG